MCECVCVSVCECVCVRVCVSVSVCECVVTHLSDDVWGRRDGVWREGASVDAR